MYEQLNAVLSIMICMLYVILIIKALSYLLNGFNCKRNIFILVVIILLCIFIAFLSVCGVYCLLR